MTNNKPKPEPFDVDLSNFPDDAYVSVAMMGDCRVCGVRQDLRCGACFHCSDQVDGKKIEGGHLLWDTKNPKNQWIVKVQ